MDTARGLTPVNRRRALTTLAVGIFAPNVLAACFGGSSKQSEKAKPPAEVSVTFRPADKAVKAFKPRALDAGANDPPTLAQLVP